MKKYFYLTVVLLLTQIFFSCQQDPPNSINTTNITSNSSISLVTEIKSPAKANSQSPELTKSFDSKILINWVQKLEDKEHALYFATLENNSWSQPNLVAKSNNWFINWADFPSVIKLPDGSLAAHWLVKSDPSTFAYDINIARSFDDGKTWTNPILPHTDGIKTEHGFVSLFAWENDKLGAIWLDGRKIKSGSHEEENLDNEMTLRFAAIDKTGKLSEETSLDERVCDCCPTSVAFTSQGAIAVYRDRSKEEFRDISVVRYQNGKWTEPKPLYLDNWKINGCPVNGPVVVAKENAVAVAWFSGADGKSKVKLIFSNTSGETFNAPITIAEGDVTGRVDLVMLTDSSVLLTWLAGTEEKGSLNIARVWADGKQSKVLEVAQTSISRKSGIPKLVYINDQAIIAWTDPSISTIRTVRLNIDNLK
jgi:hypothetical protein